MVVLDSSIRPQVEDCGRIELLPSVNVLLHKCVTQLVFGESRVQTICLQMLGSLLWQKQESEDWNLYNIPTPCEDTYKNNSKAQ